MSYGEKLTLVGILSFFIGLMIASIPIIAQEQNWADNWATGVFASWVIIIIGFIFVNITEKRAHK
jgi:uncharacterized membrane protein